MNIPPGRGIAQEVEEETVIPDAVFLRAARASLPPHSPPPSPASMPLLKPPALSPVAVNDRPPTAPSSLPTGGTLRRTHALSNDQFRVASRQASRDFAARNGTGRRPTRAASADANLCPTRVSRSSGQLRASPKPQPAPRKDSKDAVHRKEHSKSKDHARSKERLRSKERVRFADNVEGKDKVR